MPNLSVVVYGWAGAPVVGPGASVFHCQEGDEATLVAAADAFFNAVKVILPDGVQISRPTSGDVLDELSGTRVGTWSGPGSLTIVGSGGTAYVNGVGARVKWPTIGVVNGRSVTGSTFIVPLNAASYEGAGNITATALTVLQNAAITFATTPNGLRIYSRKTLAHGGVSFPALTGSAPDKVSWLRSRRT